MSMLHGSSKRPKGDNGGHNIHLPHEIIIDILTRIPGKDLHRFKCICKPWYNLFDDPLFTSLYKTRTSSPRGFISLEQHFDEEKQTTTYNFVFVDIDKKEEKLIPFRPPEEDLDGPLCALWICIHHCLGGMLLMSFGYQYFVYNLVTASWLYMGERMLGILHVFLAYDPIIPKYKVVSYSYRKFHILSDMKWSYVAIPDHLKDFEIDVYCKPVSINCYLHWIMKNGDDEELIRLDTRTEKISTIQLPAKDSYNLSEYHGLLEMGGSLWLFHAISDYNKRDYNKVQLWYLKKKKKNDNCGYVDDEWVMMCNINLLTEISLQQLKRSAGNSVKSPSSPVVLKYVGWTTCSVLLVMDPKLKIVFTFLDHERHTYVFSYDIDHLNQGNLIYCMANKNSPFEQHRRISQSPLWHSWCK